MRIPFDCNILIFKPLHIIGKYLTIYLKNIYYLCNVIVEKQELKIAVCFSFSAENRQGFKLIWIIGTKSLSMKL